MLTSSTFSRFDNLQTFYIDAAATGYSNEVYLTSIELFFKRKDNTGAAQSPGVVVAICELTNDTPDLSKIVAGSIVRVPYDRIYTSSIDASLSTIFAFDKPLMLKTNSFYGIVINYENPGFELWYNKIGDPIVGTNTPSTGINSARDGKFYNGGTADSPRQPSTNIDLKYKVNVAKFTANTITAEIVNKDLEFFTIDNIVGDFSIGELVYNNIANNTGTVAITLGNSTITGTGTTFENLQIGQSLFVLNSASEANAVPFTVETIISNTSIIVKQTPLFTNTAASFKLPPQGSVVYFNKNDKKLYLTDSTANTSLKFANNDTLYGTYSKASATITSVDNFRVDRFIPSVGISAPATTVSNNNYTFSYSNGSTYIVDTNLAKKFEVGTINNVSKYEGYVVSRSIEVDSGYLFNTAARKSAITKMTFNINQNVQQLFSTPYISADDIDFYVHQTEIVSNTYTTNIDGVTYDTEVEKNGIATSKHISTKVTFANNRFAEDVRVFANIYRPTGTDIKVYCKIHNSADPETFDDKQWTPLEVIENGDKYSSSENANDYIEVSYGLPKYSETANTVPGTFTVQSGNTVLLCTNNVVNTYITTGDVVKVYNQLFPDNYFIASVTQSNTTTITVGNAQTNNSVLGTGFKVDKLKYKNIAFTNPQNDNVCTYFNSRLGQFDRFTSMQIKIVFLSDTYRTYPKVNDISVIGVSA